jgi:heme-degrading monooxygenase HmoA
MIERHVTFHVYPDKGKEFEELFVEKYRPAMATMAGFVGVELLRQVDQVTPYQMVIRFQSAEHAAGWRASAAHQSLQPKLKALYTDSQVQVYDVIA